MSRRARPHDGWSVGPAEPGYPVLDSEHEAAVVLAWQAASRTGLRLERLVSADGTPEAALHLHLDGGACVTIVITPPLYGAHP